MCVCVWRISLQQDAYTGGMSIPFVDPWERSSISLLGTALMRPGILPFIPHSLQLGTAHSFHYGRSRVFVYTDTMSWAKTAHSPRPQKNPASLLTPRPRTPGVLYFSGFGVRDFERHGGCFRVPPHNSKINTEEGHMVVICRFSLHGMYNIP